MKHTKCWDCAFLAGCPNYEKGYCEDFIKWKLTFKEVAKMCNIHERTFYKWFAKCEKEALAIIYKRTGYKFEIYYDGCKRCLVRKLSRGYVEVDK